MSHEIADQIMAQSVQGKTPGGKDNDPPLPPRRARLTWASQIEPRPVVWAWEEEGHGRLPTGALALAAGREGTGKSSYGLWLAAKVTKGTLSGSLHGTPRPVFYVAVEDSWEQTLVPRLMAAGADRTKVARFDVVTEEGTEGTLCLPADLRLLEDAIVEYRAAMVVIDPLMSAINSHLDTHKTRDVRTALDPLARLADRTGAVILGIAHFGKGSGSDAASLITGSGAFKDVPRAIFGFAKDDDGTRVMTQVKNSLGRCDLPSLAYEIEEDQVPTEEGPAFTAKFVFLGESDRSVEDILRSGPGESAEERSDRADAATWLRDYLSDPARGGEAPALEVFKEGEKNGFSKDTLKRAKRKAGVKSETAGVGKGWVWKYDPAADTESN